MTMFEYKNHVIHLADGRLSPKSTTSRDDVSSIVSHALNSSKPSGIVIHFHGGLVSKSTALKSVTEKLFPLYAEQAQAYPIFFVWESGFLEAPLNNLEEIKREMLFQEFVKKAAEWVLKKLPSGIGFKGGSGAYIDEARLRDDFDAYFAGLYPRPPEQLEKQTGVSDASIASKSKAVDLDELELEVEIEDSIQGDIVFQEAVLATYNGLYDQSQPRTRTRGEGTTVSATSLISKEAAHRIFEPAPRTTKGLTIVWIKAAKAIAAIVIRVIRRLRKGRGHGMYVTLVEETLRELYVDKIGRLGWWDRMKIDTADAFKDGQEYGGTALLTELKSHLDRGVMLPKITLIGHSTGAIYICNLLKAAAERVPSLQFDVIFEAPAATHGLLAATAEEHGSRIRNFRQFGMSDEREATDVLVSIVYTSSLLYFVSGLLETEPDEPLVGMARYLDRQVYDADSFPYLETCRQFYSRYSNSLVWSPSSQGTGLSSDGMHHGEFDDVDKPTMASVQYILQHGF